VHAGITIVSTIYVIVASRKVRARGTAAAIIDARARARAAAKSRCVCAFRYVFPWREVWKDKLGKRYSHVISRASFDFRISPNINPSGYTRIFTTFFAICLPSYDLWRWGSRFGNFFEYGTLVWEERYIYHDRRRSYVTCLSFSCRATAHGKDTSNFVERILEQICQNNLQKFLDHLVTPEGAVHVRFITAEKKRRYRSETPFPIDGDTGDRGSFALDSLETFGRTFDKLERHITSISLFARFSSDKRQSRAVYCLQGSANRSLSFQCISPLLNVMPQNAPPLPQKYPIRKNITSDHR